MAERDHQRIEEVERQRGYGEGFRKGKKIEDQPTDAAGYKDGSPVADQQDHEADFVTDMEDERVPDAPNDGHDDASSAEIDTHEAIKARPNEHILEDAYAMPDPGVEPRG